jgi:hypothetical protein
VVPGGDLVSFDFTITPSTPPVCVVNYIITATSGGVSRNITVPAGQVDGSTPVNVDGFNVCGANHSFAVAPVTSDGQAGPRSDSVDIPALDSGGSAGKNLILAGQCFISVSDFKVSQTRLEKNVL